MNLLNLFYISLALAGSTKSKELTARQLCFTSNSHIKMFASSFRSGVLERAQRLATEHTIFSDSSSIYSTDDLDLINKISVSFNQGCKVLVGSYTSKECLLIGPIAKKFDTVVISPTCGHPDVSKFNGTIFTLVPSLEAHVAKANELLNKKILIEKSDLVVYQPSDVFSERSFHTFQSTIKRKYEFIRVNADGDMYDKDLSKLNGSYFAVHILTYPVVAYKIFEQFKIRGFNTNKLVLVGSSSWSFDTSVLEKNRRAIESFENAYMPEIEKPKNAKFTDFNFRYKRKYGESPLGIHIMSFDATTAAMRCIHPNRPMTSKDVRKCLYEKSFDGASGGFNFNKSTPFSKREIVLSDLKEKLKE